MEEGSSSKPIACPHLSAPRVSKNPQSLSDFLEVAPDAMVLVDPAGTIVDSNSQAEKLFGFVREEMIGHKVEMLLPTRFREQHERYRSRYGAAPTVRAMGAGLELYGVRKNGTEFPVEISLGPLQTERGLIVVSAIRDITDRKEIEAQLRISISEKEILLKEVHHRVKNNLQVISSLLNFQADSLTDEKARRMFQDTRSRIKSIALIHERLYQSEDLTHIDFADYVRGLMDDLFESYGVARDRVTLQVAVDSVTLDVDTLVNCGFIVSELVSNALKYAFPNERRGRISISMRSESPGRNVLRVADDGVGLPATSSNSKTSSLGLKLVRGLAKEIGGELDVQSDGGATFTIKFPA